ncbi:hypothetical protein QNI19_15965 [Cytophagaceae bacterium DM2B3-1]|uniref:DUF4369 domain-containing protein n=1 Tax=Xanthocytophaga flava TaxID=3048013 RepID=A0ABT7CL21_9BACT|nr:hypothetical protein [Xanthocytophaga flavus]MDJ1494441.1 hypothetical protein [Xanthocytophaga flavus]
MKKTLLLLVFFYGLQATWAQTDSSAFLFAKRHKFRYIIEIKNDSGFVYKLEQHSFHIVLDVLIAEDTVILQPKSEDDLYIGKKFQFGKDSKNRVHLVDKCRPQKSIKIKVDSISNQNANYMVNEGYWYSRFSQLNDTLHLKNPWITIGPVDAFSYWQAFTKSETASINVGGPHKSFQVFAMNKLKQIRDSIEAKEAKNVNSMQSILDSATILSADKLKDKFRELSGYEEKNYFDAAAHALSKQHPQNFFELVEAAPDLKKKLYQSLYYDKQIVTTLKSVETTSPIKDDFLKKQKKVKLVHTIVVSAVSIGTISFYVLLGWGIYALAT